MLKINYAADISNKEKMDGLFNAIHYESNTMMIAVNNDAIAICDKKIENKSGKLTEIQIEAIESSRKRTAHFMQIGNLSLLLFQEQVKSLKKTVKRQLQQMMKLLCVMYCV